MSHYRSLIIIYTTYGFIPSSRFISSQKLLFVYRRYQENHDKILQKDSLTEYQLTQRGPIWAIGSWEEDQNMER